MSKKSIKGIILNNNIHKISKIGNLFYVSGFFGIEKMFLKYDFYLFLINKIIYIRIFKKTNFNKSILGTYHSVIKNLIMGVSKGFKASLAIDGLGYYAKKSILNKKKVFFELGYSDYKTLIFKKKVKFDILEKGKRIDLFCTNNILLGNIINKIITIRKYNLYKGKGIRFYHEKKILKQRKKK